MADDDGLPDTPDTPDTPAAVDHDAAHPAPHPAPATPPRSRRTGLIAGAITMPAALCPPFTSVLNNRIAIFQFNGVCGMNDQILAAQGRGAIGAIVRSPIASAITLNLTGSGVTIPVMVLGSGDADALLAAIRAGTNVTASLQYQPSLRRDSRAPCPDEPGG